jgi:hypothetical protein
MLLIVRINDGKKHKNYIYFFEIEKNYTINQWHSFFLFQKNIF